MPRPARLLDDVDGVAGRDRTACQYYRHDGWEFLCRRTAAPFRKRRCRPSEAGLDTHRRAYCADHQNHVGSFIA